MTLFAVTLSDNTIDIIENADAYQQEGPMTTFFSFREGGKIVDSWSKRLASYRTSTIVAIRRSPQEQAEPAANAPTLKEVSANYLALA